MARNTKAQEKSKLKDAPLSLCYRKGRGEAFVWLSGGATTIGVVMIVALITLILYEGGKTFWPRNIEKFTLGSGDVLMGTVWGERPLDLRDLPLQKDGTPWKKHELPSPEPSELLIRQGNQGSGLYDKDRAFHWVKTDIPELDEYKKQNTHGYNSVVVARETVEEAILIERLEKGVLTGFIVDIKERGKVLASKENDGAEKVWNAFQQKHEEALELHEKRTDIETDELGEIQWLLTKRTNKIQKIAYNFRDSPNFIPQVKRIKKHYEEWSQKQPFYKPASSMKEYRKLLKKWYAELKQSLKTFKSSLPLNQEEQEAFQQIKALSLEQGEIQTFDYTPLYFEAQNLLKKEKEITFKIQTVDGEEADIVLANVVRASRPGKLSFFGKLGIYLDRFWEFLSEEPREANTEGGILKVIIGTLLMTVFMSLAVVPFGVVTALYLKEYAKQGTIVSAVRIAVNNLAGVPSIVFGIFGLGFFCILVGGSIDQIFFPEFLPSPTFGGGGLLWASLTLALLTVPVVVVATEEAISSVPVAQREASLGCGASKFQTIWRVVLPQSLPGILTGAILAMARGAGEVAPLMLVGVVKSAPTPIDGNPPFVHLDQQFMHLGFHIYDIGFQSPSVDNTKPLVFTTALVLLVLVGILNIFAIRIRSRLSKKFQTSHV